MDKEQLKRLLQKYLDGQPTAREQKMLEAWIVLAEKHHDELSEQDKAFIKNRLWERVRPAAEVSAVLSDEQHFGVVRFSKRMLRYAALWAGLVVFLVAGYLFRYRILDMIDPVTLQTKATGPYEIKKLLLPDSSIVTLAANSSISYPEKYRGTKRYAALKGKAFFSITHNPAKPFVVESDDIQVKVLGTSFEVNNAATADAVVTVVTGKVQVSVADKPVALLTPDQQVTYRRKDGLVTIANNIDAVNITNWTNNNLVFNETPLAIVLQTVAAEYGINIENIRTATATQATFSGSFTRKESWKDVLDVICISSGLSWSVTNGNTVVIKRAS